MARRRQTETDEYIAFTRRILRAMEPRIANADPEDLAELIKLSKAMDDAIAAAVRGQRANGFSWAQIAAPLGITRQAAQKRWGRLDLEHPDRADQGAQA